MTKPVAKTIIARRPNPLRAEPKLLPKDILDKIGIEAICDKVANAEYYESIATWCGVSRGYLMKYLGEHEIIYAPAREARMDKLAQDIIEISDTCNIGTITTEKPTGIEIKTADMVDRSRLQIDARKWLASKMFPKKYGDKLAIGGADDMPPIQTITSEMTPQDAARAYAEMVAGKKS